MAVQEQKGRIVDEVALQATGLPTAAPTATPPVTPGVSPFPISQDVAPTPTVSPAVQTADIGKDKVAEMQQTLADAKEQALKIQESIKGLQEKRDTEAKEKTALDAEQAKTDRELGIKEAALDLEAEPGAPVDEISPLATSLDENYNKLQNQLQNIEAGTSLTPSELAAIESLRGDFDRVRDEQSLINENFEQGTRIVGARAGRQEYATNRYMSDVQEAVNLGQSKLREIDVAESKAVNQLKAAFESKKYDQAYAAYETLNNLTVNKANIIADMQEATAKAADAAAKERIDEENAWDDTKSPFFDTAVAAGAPPEVSYAISQATNMGELLIAGEGWLQKATGEPGEFLFANRELEKAGRAPISWEEFMSQKDKKAAQGADLNRMLNLTEAKAFNVPFGSKVSDVIGMVPTGKPTEGNLTSNTYATRMKSSMPTIDELQQDIVDMVPVFFAAQIRLENTDSFSATVSDTIRQQRQAERNFLNAVLRKESGAVISPDEFSSGAKQYFPRPGDDETTLKLKTQNREDALSGMIRSAGPAYIPGEETSVAEDIITGGDSIQATVDDYYDNNPDQRDSMDKMERDGKTPEEIKELMNI